jgi:hypothetical protein
MDLLTTYTHDSELQAVTAPPLISTIHKSPQQLLSIFQPAVSSPAVSWQQLLTVEILQLHALKSTLQRLPYRTDQVECESILWSTVSRPICLGIKHPSGAYDQIFITVRQLRVCWCGALSLTRTGLSIMISARPHRNLVPCYNISYRPHRKQFFYCCIRVCCCRNVFTELLPRNSLVYLSISWSLHNNGSTCNNIYLCTL